MAKQVDEKLVGGVSRLSGYVNKVRNEEKNVIYTVSGDMFRGSLIDSVTGEELSAEDRQNSFTEMMKIALEKDVKSMEAASSTANMLEEYFTRHELLKLDGEPRLIIHE